MKFAPPILFLALLAAAYVGVLIFLDQRSSLFDNLASVQNLLPGLMLIALAGFAMRYARWKWLLGRHGYRVPWFRGFLSYLAGFALTVSPGRVGELVRIRYFGALAVPAQPIVACFIFERSCDLIVILLLASLIGSTWPGFWSIVVFVALLIAAVAAVVAFSRLTNLWRWTAYWLRRNRWRRTARVLRVLGGGIARTAIFLNPAELTGSMIVGIATWGLQAFGFVYLTIKLGLALPLGVALAIYPLAALIGTASMIPGGIGAAETAVTVLLTQFGATLEIAAFAAITMRLCTHWFAIVLGLASATALEICPARSDRVGRSP